MSLSVPSGLIAHDRVARPPKSITIAPTIAAKREPVLADDDVRAIAAALALCAFLWALKIVLVCWYVAAKGISPLSDAPFDGALAIGGEDLFFCAALAV